MDPDIDINIDIDVAIIIVLVVWGLMMILAKVFLFHKRTALGVIGVFFLIAGIVKSFFFSVEMGLVIILLVALLLAFAKSRR